MPCPYCGHSIILTKDGWLHSQRSTDCDCNCNQRLVDMVKAADKYKAEWNRPLKEAGKS